jgi:hypothetical protein
VKAKKIVVNRSWVYIWPTATVVRQGILVEQALTGQGMYLARAENADDLLKKNIARSKVIVENRRYWISKDMGRSFDLPADTVIDGEVVTLDESGRPDFHCLQHFAAEASRIHYFVFDLLILEGRDSS